MQSVVRIAITFQRCDRGGDGDSGWGGVFGRLGGRREWEWVGCGGTLSAVLLPLIAFDAIRARRWDGGHAVLR
jgi:hypothetical protein